MNINTYNKSINRSISIYIDNIYKYLPYMLNTISIDISMGMYMDIYVYDIYKIILLYLFFYIVFIFLFYYIYIHFDQHKF
jgi:hypothetical protein